jgi:ubiquinone/menaquinone biosynthesis C-methylase UbiE
MKSIHPAQLYQLLHYTQNLEEKTVLDCGAGGQRPPLALFHEYGFKTTGIEISTSQIEASKEYEKNNNMDLNIIQGNMLDLKFPNESFTCVYSFNSSIHLSKKDTRKAVDEMLRVLKPGGIMYINFIWETANQMYLGEERAPGECWMMGRNGEEVLHTLFSEEETDEIMKDHVILLKNKQELTIKLGEELLDDAYIHYYISKK